MLIHLLSVSFFSFSIAEANTTVKASVNLPAVIECLPKLEVDSFKAQFDLNFLKSKIDQLYVTSNSFLRMRLVTMRESDGSLLKLKLASEKMKNGQVRYLLSLQKEDAKGVVVDLPVEAKHQINPSTQDFNSYLVNHDVASDVYSYLDTKLNAATMSYKKDRLDVIELEFSEPTLAKVLSCETQEKIGVICNCSKKK